MTMLWHQLTFPADLQVEGVLQFTRSLSVRARHGFLGSARPVVLEVVGNDGQLVWRLGVTQQEAEQVLGALRLSLPSLRALPINRPAIEIDVAWELRLNNQRRPLRSITPGEVSAAILPALHDTRSSELVLLQWLVGPWLPRRVVPPVSRKNLESSLGDIGRLVLDSEQAKALRDKQAEPLFGVVGRIGVRATPGRRHVLRQRLIGALQLMRSPGAGFERRLLPSFLVRHRFDNFSQPFIAWPSVLNAAELASALGWPIGNPSLSGVTYSGRRQLPPAAGTLLGPRARGLQHRITGEASFPGQSGRLQLPATDGLMHLLLTGPTGTGKSTLIANLALQDIAAGRGVVVVDPSPKADLIEDISNHIPAHRLDDVVILDPSDARPVGLNVLGGADPDLSAEIVSHVLHELYAAHWGPRTADVVHNALLTLTRHGGMTLCELPPLLLHAPFRQRLIVELRSDALGVGPFWSWFESLSDAERSTVIGPVLNKVRAFTQRPAIRGVIGQASGFDLNSVFTKRRVLLVRLAAGQIGTESAHLLGALLLGQFWTAIQARSSVSAERRHPVFTYIDEFHNLLRLPLPVGDALVTARGLGVGLVLAHQHLAQLPGEMRSAVLANARSKIVFALGHDDAAVFARQFGSGLTPDDLTNLGAFETYQSLVSGGRTTAPASATTLPLVPSLSTGGEVLRRTRQVYGQRRDEVDAALLARRDVKPVAAPVGVRKRSGGER